MSYHLRARPDAVSPIGQDDSEPRPASAKFYHSTTEAEPVLPNSGSKDFLMVPHSYMQGTSRTAGKPSLGASGRRHASYDLGKTFDGPMFEEAKTKQEMLVSGKKERTEAKTGQPLPRPRANSRSENEDIWTRLSKPPRDSLTCTDRLSSLESYHLSFPLYI